jgi:Zn-dependent protease with chaperone function
MNTQPRPGSLNAIWFDGRSAAGRPVALRREADQLVIELLSSGSIDGDGGGGEAVHRPRHTVAWRAVQWPERTRYGKRLAHLADGSSLEGADSAAWDAWLQACGGEESVVVRLQQSWRAVALAVLVLVVGCVGAYRWGLPWAAQAAVQWVPHSAEKQLGDSVFASLDGQLLEPSKLTPQEQAAWRERVAAAVQAMPAGWVPHWNLEFRSSKHLGPNAFALPGGTVVLTDDLLSLAGTDTDMVLGVVGHELGHVRQRHGLRAVAQASAMAAVASALWGDFNGLLAAVPVIMGQAAYSRDAEREADADAVALMRHNRIAPQAMARLFDALERDPKVKALRERGPDGWLGIALASHPRDDERRAFFHKAAAPH